MAVPYTFGSATAAIPLSNLDSNFATTITLGNTAIQLGNTVTTLNNMTLANVTVSSGNVTTANITTLTVGSGGINSAGNVIVGTTTNFTNTAVTGALQVAGYGIYPYVAAGATNSTVYSGINWYTPTAFAGNNGASALTLGAIISTVNVKNDGSGGTGLTRGDALQANAYVESSGVAARIRSQGVSISANRSSATDLSTRTDNIVIGAQASANHLTTAPNTIVSSNLQAFSGTASNQSGTAANQHGVASTVIVGTTAGAPTTVSTSMFQFNGSQFTVGQATGNTATVTTGATLYSSGITVAATGTMTTFYGVYLGAASVTGTLTNNWGVYSADTAAINYFGGNVGIGTTSPAATALLDVQSTTKGVRFPNMTTAQKTAITPSAGTVVFDTTLSKLCVYSGAAWQTITSV
jgi:hypothetical protein